MGALLIHLDAVGDEHGCDGDQREYGDKWIRLKRRRSRREMILLMLVAIMTAGLNVSRRRRCGCKTQDFLIFKVPFWLGPCLQPYTVRVKSAISLKQTSHHPKLKP